MRTIARCCSCRTRQPLAVAHLHAPPSLALPWPAQPPGRCCGQLSPPAPRLWACVPVPEAAAGTERTAAGGRRSQRQRRPLGTAMQVAGWAILQARRGGGQRPGCQRLRRPARRNLEVACSMSTPEHCPVCRVSGPGACREVPGGRTASFLKMRSAPKRSMPSTSPLLIDSTPSTPGDGDQVGGGGHSGWRSHPGQTGRACGGACSAGRPGKCPERSALSKCVALSCH